MFSYSRHVAGDVSPDLAHIATLASGTNRTHYLPIDRRAKAESVSSQSPNIPLIRLYATTASSRALSNSSVQLLPSKRT